MRKLTGLFVILTVLVVALGIGKVIPYALAIPIAYVLLGVSFLCNAKVYYDRGNKFNAVIFVVSAIFLFVLAFLL